MPSSTVIQWDPCPDLGLHMLFEVWGLLRTSASHVPFTSPCSWPCHSRPWHLRKGPKGTWWSHILKWHLTGYQRALTPCGILPPLSSSPTSDFLTRVEQKKIKQWWTALIPSPSVRCSKWRKFQWEMFTLFGQPCCGQETNRVIREELPSAGWRPHVALVNLRQYGPEWMVQVVQVTALLLLVKIVSIQFRMSPVTPLLVLHSLTNKHLQHVREKSAPAIFFFGKGLGMLLFTQLLSVLAFHSTLHIKLTILLQKSRMLFSAFAQTSRDKKELFG